MSQKHFTFKYEKTESFLKEHKPPYHLSWGEYVKDMLLQKGYVVKDVKGLETITVHCFMAKANIPYKERVKFQTRIDKMKPSKVVKLSTNKK